MHAASNDVYTSNVAEPLPRGAAPFLAVWLAAATLAVATGLVARAPALILPACVIGLTALTLLVLASTEGGRRFANGVSLPALAWFHAWRVVPGAAFLAIYASGSGLAWSFAVPGGIGDIAVGLTAPLGAWLANRPEKAARAGFVAWSALGAIDLANVVRAAVVESLASPASMHLLRELPLGLLPTFAVPLTFVAHALAFRRARARR